LLDTNNLTIKHLSKLIASREISCLELVDATIERIEKLNPKLNAFITVLDQSARRQAKHADSLIKQGKYLGPLHGIPISLKDLIYIKGVRSSSGSKILADFIPDYDSTVTRKLRKAGAIIVGTNNTHEFACGITNINPHYGSTKNPWDLECLVVRVEVLLWRLAAGCLWHQLVLILVALSECHPLFVEFLVSNPLMAE
jgi:aspartyl-tRNA(Asn)/glutamyl-tRNA(Gln) amidotransferase subunit A